MTREQFDFFIEHGSIHAEALPASAFPPDGAAPGPGPAIKPQPIPAATPDLTLLPAAGLTEAKEYMLGLINDARRQHGLAPVVPGDNPAAQEHAEAMLEGNFTGHWGLDGLTPPMRYTLAGGWNYVKENTSGAAARDGLPHRKRSARSLITESHEGLMQNAGHRKNILYQWHKKVNLGIACSSYACSVVQKFEGDYIDFSQKPAIDRGILSVAGNLKDGFTLSGVQVWYHQPPRLLTLGQVDATDSYSTGQEPAVFLLKPAPSGYYYSPQDLLPAFYSWQEPTDPYTVNPDTPRSKGFYSSIIPPVSTLRSKAVPFAVADTWQVGGAAFRVEGDISNVIQGLGPGVYIVVIWGENGGEEIPLTNYAIFLE